MSMELPERKQIRIDGYDYATPGAYFITVCTANKEKIFWEIVGSMKRWVSRKTGKPIWQKSFYDHAIRNQCDYDEIWRYIDTNPVKWYSDCFYMVSD